MQVEIANPSQLWQEIERLMTADRIVQLLGAPAAPADFPGRYPALYAVYQCGEVPPGDQVGEKSEASVVVLT